MTRTRTSVLADKELKEVEYIGLWGVFRFDEMTVFLEIQEVLHERINRWELETEEGFFIEEEAEFTLIPEDVP